MKTPSELSARIRELCRAKNALILVHNYELGEVQEIADFCGDSLELSVKAAENPADILVFCGVRFMAETAKILSPQKKVLLPVENAPCEMADMAGAAELRALKAQHPGALAVCYVNTTAAVKAECDLCVTSSNALELVAALPRDREIIFVPDRNLGAYCAKKTGRKLILWDGCCPVHQRLTPEMIERRRREFPGAPLLMHPEASPECLALADRALSTGGMLREVKTMPDETVIVGTELGILHRMERENPGKRFIPLSAQAICPHMKLIRLEDVLASLEQERYEIEVPEELRRRAERPIRRMLEKDLNF